MALNLKSFSTLVSDQAAAIQARATALLDFTIGSILRSFIEATAAVGLWLESLIIYTLSLTRAATSQKTDLDSWVTDYGLTRLSAAYSAGTVTFARFTTAVAGLVPIGATVRTLDGTQTFTVSLDATNVSYSSSQNGYILAIGIGSVTVPVVANIPGAGANVAAATIGLITSSTPGVDTVTNVAALSGGASAESDQGLRARFVAYIASLSKATVAAIIFAVNSLKLGVACTVIENQDPSGNTVYGLILVTVDDGTGTPPASLLLNAAAAVELVRAASVRYGVFPPVIIRAAISFSVQVGKGYDSNVVAGACGDAVTAYVNALPLGGMLPYSKIAKVAYDASPGAIDILRVLVNNGTADIAATPRNVIKVSTISVSVSP